MSALNAVRRIKDQLALAWMARTEQERKFLAVGAALAVLALVYALFVEPAVTGRAALRRQLPELRQQAAQLDALALEARALAGHSPTQVAPMTRDSLTASLAARSLKPESLTMTSEYAKIQLNGVPFASLFAWLDAQRREGRVQVQEAAITAGTPVGQVDATLTLRQNLGQSGANAR